MVDRPLIFRRRSLVYPFWLKPGFNPAHPMATATQLSAVFLNGTFINLSPGYASTIGTISGTVAQTVDNVLGVCKDVGSSYDVSFTGGVANAANSPVTMAAIIRTSTSDNAGFVCYGTTGPLLADFNGPFSLDVPGATISSGITLANNTPYFVAATWTGSTSDNIRFIVRNLITGAIFTGSTGSGGAANTYAGTGFTVGFEGKFSTFWQGRIAAVFASRAVHSPSELRAWAEDPWGFWYPDVSVNYFKTPSTVAIVETNIFSPSLRTYPPQWNINSQLLRNTAQDFSSSAVETNPHWQGRAFPPQWSLNRNLWQTLPEDFSSSAVETNPHWTGKPWSPQWILNRLLGQNTAQDFSSSAVETNVHTVFRTWPAQWALTRGLLQNSDPNAPVTAAQPETNTFFVPRAWSFQWQLNRVLSQNTAQDFSSSAVETNPHWRGGFIPAQWSLNRNLWQTLPQDFSSSAVETNPHWLGRPWPAQWQLNRALGLNTAQDFSSFAVETNVFFVPRTWPFQWRTNRALSLNTAQDFSSTPPVITLLLRPLMGTGL